MVTQGGGPRSEVLFPAQDGYERWYSFAIHFPSIGWKADKDDEIVTQWKNGGGTPTLSLRANKGKLRLRIGHSEAIPTAQWKYFDFGEIPKDEWNEYVFHVIHSNKSNGLIEVWKNGEKIVSHKGPNIYKTDDRVPRWKLGIYKSTWKKGSSNTNLRITYVDNVRIGDENASFEDLSSLKSNPSTSVKVTKISTSPSKITLNKGGKQAINLNFQPSNATNKKVTWSSSDTSVATVNPDGEITAIKTGSATITAKSNDGSFTAQSSITVASGNSTNGIESFVLINADTDKEIMFISDGDKLDYALIKNTGLNIQVNTNSPKPGSVKISLKGPESASIIENVAPYTLFGDNNGDYYEGFLPVGNYSLTATVYSGKNEGGTQVTTSTITFSITEVLASTLPETPVMIAPIDGSGNLSTDFKLSWKTAENADGYEVQLAEEDNFQLVVQNLTANTTDIGIDRLQEDTQYFWRVRAGNEAGNSNWSTVASFKTEKKLSIPDAPKLISPANGTEGLSKTAMLEWTAPDDIESFTVEVSEDKTFKIKFLESLEYPIEQLNVTGLKAGKIYFWRVKTNDAAESNLYSEAWSFQTEELPAPPVADAPTAGISTTPASASILTGEKQQFTASVRRFDAAALNITWSSSNAEIAVVNEKGMVTAIRPGNATISAKTVDGNYASTSSIKIASSNRLKVEGFILVDADANKEITSLVDRMELEYNKDLKLNIRIHTQDAIGSVGLILSGPVSSTITENVAPYALFGDTGSNYNGKHLPAGNYTLTATPYSKSSKAGEKGESATIEFSIVEKKSTVANGNKARLSDVGEHLSFMTTQDKFEHSENQLDPAADQLERFKTLTLYPNPAEDVIHLQGAALKGKATDLIVYNLNGVKQLMQEAKNNNGLLSVDVIHLIPGAYVLYANIDGSRHSFKFLKK